MTCMTRIQPPQVPATCSQQTPMTITRLSLNQTYSNSGLNHVIQPYSTHVATILRSQRNNAAHGANIAHQSNLVQVCTYFPSVLVLNAAPAKPGYRHAITAKPNSRSAHAVDLRSSLIRQNGSLDKMPTVPVISSRFHRVLLPWRTPLNLLLQPT